MFYGRNKKRMEKKLAKLEDKKDSIVENALSLMQTIASTTGSLIFSWLDFTITNYNSIKDNYKHSVDNNISIAKKFIRDGDIKEAKTRLKIALFIDNTNFHAMLALGYLLYEEQEYKQSLKYFKKIQNTMGDKTTAEITFMINELETIVKN